MRKAYGRLLFVTLIVVGLAAPVFGQSAKTKLASTLCAAWRLLEMAKSDAGLTDAIVEFKKATEIEPNMAAAWYNLGLHSLK